MSQPRFAPITASLLARKGDAGPSAMGQRPAFAWLQERLHEATAVAPPPVASPPMPQAHVPAAEKPHRVMIALSNEEFEKLGIAAVKKGTTRHLIARQAIDLYFEQLHREFREECRCMAAAAPCGGCNRT
ncbi:MAG TPA: hypothetical protein VN932_02895 [Rhizomicrobium sp.]|nr:hypothetical protein [Rhizomicrobium sp.]